jgi:hypothetical protein
MKTTLDTKIKLNKMCRYKIEKQIKFKRYYKQKKNSNQNNMD